MSDRKRILRAIKREGRYIPDARARRVFKKYAVEIPLVEVGGLRNPIGGDQDSTNLRQERASGYASKWAKTGGSQNIPAIVRRLRQEFQQQYSPGEKSYDVAAQVQRPAAQYRGRYRERAGEAARILKGSSGMGTDEASSTATYKTTPGVDNSAGRQDAKLSYLQNSHDPDALLNLGLSLRGLQDTPSTRVKIRQSPRSSANGAGSASGTGGRVKVDPNADRAGAHTHKSVVNFVRQVSSIAGQPVRIGTGTNHNQMTVNGNVSDHWSGHAADIPATGRRLIHLGQSALIAAGMSPKKARKMRGGLYNVGGHQIIFNTHEGGDHTNHLHVSA